MTTTANHRPPATFADLPRLMSLMTGDDKHDQAATSTLDVLWVLYDRVLRVTPQTAGDDGRDRFVMSKGHGPMAYYAVLAAKGFLDPADLPGFGAFGSILGLHPDRVLVPGVEVSSGSLGHGLPLAVELAAAWMRGEKAEPAREALYGTDYDESGLQVHSSLLNIVLHD